MGSHLSNEISLSGSGAVDPVRRQQACLAQFGAFAFQEEDLSGMLTKAARACAACMEVPYVKICCHRPKEGDLFTVAACGWGAGVLGHVAAKANGPSTQARTFMTGKPVVVENISRDGGGSLPAFYAEQGIASLAGVSIKGRAGPWGILEIADTEQRPFDEHDIVFLTGFANVVAEAVMAAERTAASQAAIERMKRLVAEKDKLLAERAQRELQLSELKVELLHVTRVNAMGQMAAAIAHELNQPLAAITNYMSAAKRILGTLAFDATAPDHVREIMEKAERQANRAGSIIRRLKGLVEKRESRRLAENIAMVVEETLALMGFNLTDANISVEIECDATVPPVWIDKIQIQQILINLIRNSIEAMLESDRRTLTLATGLGGVGFADVTVRDTGPGLAPDVLERLFAPFNTTKSGGMGLGLMICSNLAEANGGRIWLLEDQATGAAFRFSVPLVPSGAKGAERATVTGDAAGG